MSINLKFIIIELLFLIIEINCQSKLSSHNILDQFSYYSKNSKLKNIFNNTFIDFLNYKLYDINKSDIIHKNNSYQNFQLKWIIQNNNNISLKCVNETCLDIDLAEHSVISFDFDKLLSTNGAILLYIIILYGLFNLKRGYIYINLSFIIYGSFSFLLFMREICQLLVIKGSLKTLSDNSKALVYFVFYSTWIISILYGFVCHFSNYLKYISFGFIEGNLFSKMIFYFLIFSKIINKNLFLDYFIISLLFTIIFMAILGYLKNKNEIFNIINIAIIGGYGIIFGINIIVGGLPFIPYLILSSNYEEKSLYQNLIDNSQKWFYSILFISLIICGIYFNFSSFKKLRNKKIKTK